MKNKNTNTKEMISLDQAWFNRVSVEKERRNARRFISGLFNIGFIKKINPRKSIAITAVIINTPLPTMSLVTNPIVYKKIMRFNTDKLNRKIRVIKMRFM